MQNRNSLLVAVFLLATLYASAQTTYFPLWSKENWTLERLEIKLQRNNDLNLGTVKPLMRGTYVRVADSIRVQQDAQAAGFSAVDLYNLNRVQANNSEYSAYPSTAWKSKKPLGKGFFETPGNMLEVNQKGFYMSINPAISVQQSMEKDYDESIHFRAFGASGRGLIGNKVAFHFQATANNENGPIQFRRFVATNNAVPGAGRYNVASGNNAYSYFDFRGSLATNVTKYINVQLGYDRNFIGNGYRSLMLSDFSGQSLFVKLNTRIWKLNYTNLFMQLSPTPFEASNDRMNKKYAAMHHLSLNATKWLNIGFFESIIFGRPNRYDFAYMLPVIFYRSIEQQNGSPDNANIGFDFKANVAKKAQLYGQLMLDEFVKDEVIGNKRNWWGNKQGLQLGAKYVDAFGVSNLDLQAEMNQVRPFMYQFRDTTGSYAHYNQPLAHPMGANLREFIGIVRYQPTNKLYFFARVNYWKQGLDSAGYNFGYNPNTLYSSTGQGGLRLRSDNYPLFTGMPATGLNAAITASYELKENLFVEAQAQYRSYKETNKDKLNTTLLTIGLRWNMFRKDYDY